MIQNLINNFINFYKLNNELTRIKKNVDSSNHNKLIEINDLILNIIKNNSNAFFKISRQCRRCKQKFISKNLLHNYFQHCKKDIKKSKSVVIIKKLDKS